MHRIIRWNFRQIVSCEEPFSIQNERILWRINLFRDCAAVKFTGARNQWRCALQMFRQLQASRRAPTMQRARRGRGHLLRGRMPVSTRHFNLFGRVSHPAATATFYTIVLLRARAHLSFSAPHPARARRAPPEYIWKDLSSTIPPHSATSRLLLRLCSISIVWCARLSMRDRSERARCTGWPKKVTSCRIIVTLYSWKPSMMPEIHRIYV